MALEAAQALARVASELRESGYSLVIWDAYRTPEAQRALLGDTQDERYVLEESNHCRGQAVDVTLARTQGGGLLDMGTDHDYFGERAHLNTTDISDEQRANRQLLVDTMERQGFSTWPYEWWHFDYAS